MARGLVQLPYASTSTWAAKLIRPYVDMDGPQVQLSETGFDIELTASTAQTRKYLYVPVPGYQSALDAGLRRVQHRPMVCGALVALGSRLLLVLSDGLQASIGQWPRRCSDPILQTSVLMPGVLWHFQISVWSFFGIMGCWLPTIGCCLLSGAP